MFGRNKEKKDKRDKVKTDRRSKVVIRRHEMVPDLSSLENNVLLWLSMNKFAEAPEYGEHYYLHHSYGVGTLGCQYEITPEEDLILYCHYQKPEHAKPLNIDDPSFKAMHHYGNWLTSLFVCLKGQERFRPEDVSVYFAKVKK